MPRFRSKRPVELALACFEAFLTKDRAAIEALLHEDFHFTSALDNRLDRAAYFEVCWPNAKHIARFEYLLSAESDGRAYVTYIGHTHDGGRFQNTEVFTVRDDKLLDVEVYFGWKVPHDVPAGTHRDPA